MPGTENWQLISAFTQYALLQSDLKCISVTRREPLGSSVLSFCHLSYCLGKFFQQRQAADLLIVFSPDFFFLLGLGVGYEHGLRGTRR